MVEVDGPIHDDQKEYDAERERVIAARNLHIPRVTNNDVFQNLPAVLARILDECRAAIADRQPDCSTP